MPGCKVPHRFLQGPIRPPRQAAFLLQRFSTEEADKKERKNLLAVNPGTQVTQRLKPTPNSPPIPIILDRCPECDAPLGKHINGAEQKRTVADIPLPDHSSYEIVYPRYWYGDCKKMVCGEAGWLPPKAQEVIFGRSGFV